MKKDLVDENHFRSPFNSNLKVSSVGLGTYHGDPTDLDALKTFNAIIDSVKSGGVNILDSALNFRYMKSERTIGAALRFLI